jgi:hypothetical protein
MKKQAILFLICLLKLSLSAQTSVNSAGGEATGSNGQISFSVGEIIYTTMNNASYSVAQGIQQPYIPPFNFSISASSPIICEDENTTISITIE